VKDLIYFTIIGGLFAMNIWSIYKDRKKNNFVYRVVIFSRVMDWLWALLLIICVISFAALVEPYLPELLKWNLFSILGKNGTNANIEILKIASSPSSSSSSLVIISKLFILSIFLLFLLLIPKAAYWEEIQFRSGTTRINKKVIIRNLKFGLMHCIIGVPIWVGFILGGVGMAYSVRYIRVYKRTSDEDLALMSCTSLHGKYNLILILLLAIIVAT